MTETRGDVGPQRGQEGRATPRLTLSVALLLLAVGIVMTTFTSDPQPSKETAPSATAEPTPSKPAKVSTLPGGRTRIFDGRFLVAYYGAPGTGSLGVLGETRPEVMHRRLIRAAKPFAGPGRKIQPVYEVIVTVADARPGKDRDFSHDVPKEAVRDYIQAAHQRGALVLLDLQTGRSSFAKVAKRWEWALKDPWVGLALDPEWRMKKPHVPGRVLGSVRAAEVNQVSGWLSALVKREHLPEKVLMLHQFRPSMVRKIERIKRRPGLVLVQHVDGFGPPGAKVGTYHRVTRPKTFIMGFKLFYDEDRPRTRPKAVLRIRPKIRFVSFQ